MNEKHTEKLEVTFLNFIEVPTSGKTKRFKVYSSHGGDFLGCIYWRNGWRRYVMSFEDGCDWSVECMAECYKFIAKLMQERTMVPKEGCTRHWTCADKA